MTLSLTGYWVNIPEIGGGGGMHYCIGVYPIYTTMLIMSQGVGYALEMYLSGTPPFAAAPTDFTISANGADLSADLDWINPSLDILGEPLEDLDGIIIKRDGEVIADITDVQIGEPSSYFDDDIPAAGLYNYTVFGYNDWGWGAQTWGSAWIGPDVPCAPGNFAVIPDPGGLLENTLTWETPDSGAHGAYFTGTDTYNIYRALQGDSLELVTDLITGTSYVDELTIQGWYEYGIAGVNGSGEGVMAEFGPVFVGPPEFQVIPYDWVEISGTNNTGITGDDQNMGPFDMGMAFPWHYGEVYSSIRVCSNGWLSFTSNNSNYSNQQIPTAGEPGNLVCPYWDDLYPPDGGDIWYWYDEVNERFIIEFEDINHILGIEGYYFEAIFYPDGTIDFMYQQIGDILNSCTVGIENEDGTQGIQIAYNGSGPYLPVSQSGVRIYPVFVPPMPDIDITLTPYGTPIVIPAGGGDFEFNIMAANNELTAINTDVWTNITLPSGAIYGPIINVPGLMLAAAAIIERDRSQGVPVNAPAGTYSYNAYAGIYPYLFYGEDHFNFEKSAAGDGSGYDDWYSWGEAFPGEVLNAPDVPDDYSLSEAYPNPFNHRSMVSFTLKHAGNVRLTVYDVSGREVAVLAKGFREAGNYKAVFDSAGLATGVYFYRLSAGDFCEVRKMVLVK